jgi:hypothetical protein
MTKDSSSSNGHPDHEKQEHRSEKSTSKSPVANDNTKTNQTEKPTVQTAWMRAMLWSDSPPSNPPSDDKSDVNVPTSDRGSAGSPRLDSSIPPPRDSVPPTPIDLKLDSTDRDRRLDPNTSVDTADRVGVTSGTKSEEADQSVLQSTAALPKRRNAAEIREKWFWVLVVGCFVIALILLFIRWFIKG